MEQHGGDTSLKKRIRSGQIRQRDVTRRLAELAFGKANDCVRLALEDDPSLGKLDLSLLSEVKRNDKGTVEITQPEASPEELAMAQMRALLEKLFVSIRKWFD